VVRLSLWPYSASRQPLTMISGIGFEEADQFLSGRHQLTGQHPPLALFDDAIDQRPIVTELSLPQCDERIARYGPRGSVLRPSSLRDASDEISFRFSEVMRRPGRTREPLQKPVASDRDIICSGVDCCAWVGGDGAADAGNRRV
jgi:hypothetical protein